jgi:hypothetical protein
MSSSDVEMDSGPNNLAYDPDQDPEEKRDVRKKYRAIQKTTEGAFLQPKFSKIPTNSYLFSSHRSTSSAERMFSRRTDCSSPRS